MSEIDVQTKKNVIQKIDAAHKRLNIKQHNLKAAAKARKADPAGPFEDRSLHEKLAGTKRARSLGKKYRSTKKTRDFLYKQEDKLDKHGIWSKENKKGSSYASREKDKLQYMGVYRDKKGGEVLEAPKGAWTKTKKDTFKTAWDKRQSKKGGGGAALRGLGRAFVKGGKV